jgi:hypothetical protein
VFWHGNCLGGVLEWELESVSELVSVLEEAVESVVLVLR